jgi:hypothetical protein
MPAKGLFMAFANLLDGDLTVRSTMIPEFEYRILVFLTFSGILAWATLIAAAIYAVMRYR